jgi:hypothetical protein
VSVRVLIAGVLLLADASVWAATAEKTAESSIPFASSDGIIDWKVVSADSLYLLSASGDWYLARTSAPCRRMRSALVLGFDTAGSDRLDRFGAIVAEGRRCPIASLVRSAEPEGWRAKKRGRRS